MEENNLEHGENKCKQDGDMKIHGEHNFLHVENNKTSLHTCIREKRETRALEEIQY